MKYQNNFFDDKIQCLICPRKCILKNGQNGFCHTRKSDGEKIVLTTYGYNTGLAIDPVEKKPLYHFYPSSSVLSFGTQGCVLGCRFCQNYSSSRAKDNPLSLNKCSPFDVIEIVKKYKVDSVAFTYNDPIAFFEYALDCAKLCREEGIRTIAVTSGYMNIEPAIEFFKFIDAVNIDLKGFSEKFYQKNCYANLKPVLDVINYVKNETNCHLELTTLLIEGENDSFDEIKMEIDWILNNLKDDTPLHFSAFTPRYKFIDRKPTGFETLLKAYNLAYEMGLKYVYTGNLSNTRTSTTYCKHCNRSLVVRNGYKIEQYNLKDGNCIFCGTKADGRFY